MTVCGAAAANDYVDGAEGNDRVSGGIGNDTLLGGEGKDTFLFNTALSSLKNVDSCDFEAGVDRFALDDAVFHGSDGTGPLSAAFKQIGLGAIDSSDRIIYDKASGKVFYDADGSGGVSAQILFATVDAGTVLKASDFLVY